MQLPLLEFASSKCVREIYIEDERKQEIAKNAKDDGEKKERGGGGTRRAISGKAL